MITQNRLQIFSELKDKLILLDKNIELYWCTDLAKMKESSLIHHQDKDYIFLNFGECIIFGNLKIQLSTSKQTNAGTKFNEIGGSLNNNEEAKDLYKSLENILGQADHYSESYNEIYVYWEDAHNKIIISPRHHMGGEWFEYKIINKNCT